MAFNDSGSFGRTYGVAGAPKSGSVLLIFRQSSDNITSTVREHFGNKAGHWLTWAYCFSIYPILLMYSIGMTNVVIDYVEKQLEWDRYPEYGSVWHWFLFWCC